LNSVRGMLVLVPRNMVQAAGFYNTLFKSDDPALVVECLNGYRLKEKLPDNVGEFCVPVGQPEILQEGTDVTIVTYGSMCRVVMEAAAELETKGISCEVIDVQSLLPFDVHHTIVESLKKTNRVVFADEDVPGGATAFMMQQVLEVQKGYQYLDSTPLTITAKEHRPAYGSDGDYFSKPNPEEIFERVYELVSEDEPSRFPSLS
jgi:pyruvate/2-oxoglutarate/acetoin dehydrogenase E1 component